MPTLFAFGGRFRRLDGSAISVSAFLTMEAPMLGKAAIATAFAAGCLAGSQSALADAPRSIVQGIQIGRSAETLPLGRVVSGFPIDAVEARGIARRHGLKPPFQAARTPFGWSLFKTDAARGGPTLVVLYLDGQLLAIK